MYVITKMSSIANVHHSISTCLYCFSVRTTCSHVFFVKDRYIVVREVDGALREATWDERDRMNQIYYPKTGRKLNMPRMLTGDYLPDVLKNKRHLDVLDLCNVQCEADSPQYIEVSVYFILLGPLLIHKLYVYDVHIMYPGTNVPHYKHICYNH